MRPLFAALAGAATLACLATSSFAQIAPFSEAPMARAGRDDGPWRTCINEEHTISLDRAIDACSRLIGGTPYRASRAHALRLRAELYDAQGDDDLAIADYQRALGIYSQEAEGVRPDADAFIGRGVIHYKLEQYDLALADFNRAMEIKNDSASAYFNRAMVRFRRRDYPGAIADFEEAGQISARAGSTVYAYHMGRCIGRAAGDVELDRARNFCDRAVSRSDGAATALAARGYLLFRQGEFERAASDFARAVEDDPYDAAALYGRGVTSIRLGRQSEGEADVARAREMDSADVDFYAMAGMAP